MMSTLGEALADENATRSVETWTMDEQGVGNPVELTSSRSGVCASTRARSGQEAT